MATIHSIVYQPAPSVHELPYHYNRIPTEAAELITNHGIEGDIKAGKHPERHLNIMFLDTLNHLSDEGFHTEPGQMGEQIIIAGLDEAALESGVVIQLGDTAQVELTKPRTGCDWFELVQGKSGQDAVNRMGYMATVTQGGSIKVGDAVQVVSSRST